MYFFLSISVGIETGLSIGLPNALFQINWERMPKDLETPNNTVKKSYSFIPYFNNKTPEWASTLGHGFLTFPVASNIEGTKGWCFVECGGLTDPIKIRARLQAMISLINEMPKAKIAGAIINSTELVIAISMKIKTKAK